VPGFRSTDTFNFFDDRSGDHAVLYGNTIYLRPAGEASRTIIGPIPASVPCADTDNIEVEVDPV